MVRLFRSLIYPEEYPSASWPACRLSLHRINPGDRQNFASMRRTRPLVYRFPSEPRIVASPSLSSQTQPVIPMYKPIWTNFFSSSSVPVKQCTTAGATMTYTQEFTQLALVMWQRVQKIASAN